jgi:hypothetical protein
MAPDGTLFCPKCGYTLPQGTAGAGPPPGAMGGIPPVPAPVLPPNFTGTSPGGPVSPAAPGSVPGPTPVGPSPLGKYCVRCHTVIARPAVYCPVCQSPQP